LNKLKINPISILLFWILLVPSTTAAGIKNFPDYIISLTSTSEPEIGILIG